MDGFDFLGWHFKVDSKGRFKSTPHSNSYKEIKEEVKKTWRNTGTPDKSGGKKDTETRLKMIGSKVRGWRNYHKFCDMGKHSLWFLNHWLWKKLRRDKVKAKEKEITKLLSRKKSGRIANAKAAQLKGSGGKVKRAAKRILTDSQIHLAFPSVPHRVNSHVMVKGAASPYDGNLIYWVNRESKKYEGSYTGNTMKRQKMKCTHCNKLFWPGDIVELHHINRDHNNWKPKNCVALHRECHQHQEVHKERIKDGKRGRAA